MGIKNIKTSSVSFHVTGYAYLSYILETFNCKRVDTSDLLYTFQLETD
jgi:hypothetical protein